MNINDLEEFVTGMTSEYLDCLAKMARDEQERRKEDKLNKAWEKVCIALHAYQEIAEVVVEVHEGPNSYDLKLDEDGFDPDCPGVFLA